MSETRPRPEPENLLLNLACNVGAPFVVLTWLSGERAFGPKWGLLVALVFPLGYGTHDFVRRRRTNFISVLGFVSVLITGGFGLMKVDVFWFAVKDAAIPAAIGLAVLASLWSKTSLVRELLCNPQVIDVERVDTALDARGTRDGFERKLREAGGLLAAAFGVSAVLNYFLARHIITSPLGTEASNRELARMHWMSLLVIGLPSMAVMLLALWRLIEGLKALTGLTLDEILRTEPPKPGKTPATPSP